MGLPLDNTPAKATESGTTGNGCGATTTEGHTTPIASGAGVNTGAGTSRPKTDAEKEADRLYEEAMEEEYAKRDGGA
ncbi:hypothetical protein BN1723_002053 [Verticillium longisporum]|uniref:Uncharacterized protein n=3 Tax=Verticillium TaxID=1036719 RepID=G2XIW1_VERDV|nr:uncharacterized protein VDAG_10084 [Verticillium dahliae VdLs.17]KAF3347390.1 hypothetical protein VdG2_04480 [Verticillium dahliae VDG2]KAF3358762.1 hypothetical protein VdG1_05316 [Verticillium dahliae VDG1]KAG7152401.1 hypothetical protein HYQ46_011760 [Verticillium longisporum]PNH34005.1 hypothetical protein BJF96_g3017 [Verticillium dahliae]EGY20455.1 hypothetical protein VDAG_10084 [Verticillium dahliae VdLs.17]